ncbi:unnamed protein product [Prorocentrum cordatum]|uniref:HMA domain-containing protein n=1 Tax=Prorocentrum cordatum TaxID=2364126 RepID=A0ABN9V938_9DINO|nr:unnamed protein product [Polarella glacialis]
MGGHSHGGRRCGGHGAGRAGGHDGSGQVGGEGGHAHGGGHGGGCSHGHGGHHEGHEGHGGTGQGPAHGSGGASGGGGFAISHQCREGGICITMAIDGEQRAFKSAAIRDLPAGDICIRSLAGDPVGGKCQTPSCTEEEPHLHVHAAHEGCYEARAGCEELAKFGVTLLQCRTCVALPVDGTFPGQCEKALARCACCRDHPSPAVVGSPVPPVVHKHSATCGHPVVKHGDHVDYIVQATDGRLLLEHAHCAEGTADGPQHNDCHGEIKQSAPFAFLYRDRAGGSSISMSVYGVSLEALLGPKGTRQLSGRKVTTVMIVEGICCPSEVPIIDNILQKLSGVDKVSTNVTAKQTTVEHNPMLTSPEDLVHALNKASLGARLRRGDGEDEQMESRCPSPLLLVCGLLWIVSFASLADHDEETWVHYLKYVALAAVAVGSPRILLKAWGALRNRVLDINCLMGIAVCGAIGIGDYVEAAAVVFLFRLSEWLEFLATAKARNALAAVLAMRPEQAVVAGTGQKIPVDEVVVGSRLAVRAGDKVPVDGVVVEGTSGLDESALTGESVPARKRVGSRVFAGTVNVGGGYLEIEATALVGDSAVARMVKLIEEAQASRSKTEILVERFAKVYTPIVVVSALLLGAVPWIFLGEEEAMDWLYRALVLLVVACPCALVISTPVTYVSTLSTAATHNILVRGGDTAADLEVLGRVQTMCMDKTGTLSEGRFRVRTVLHVGEGRDSRAEHLRLMGYLAAVERLSTHPLASALVAHARSEGAEDEGIHVEDVQELPGEGLEATIQGASVQIGSRRLARRMGWAAADARPQAVAVGIDEASTDGGERLQKGTMAPDVAEQVAEIEAQAQTVCYLGVGGRLATIIGVADAPREEAAGVVKALRDLGVDVVMLTGDRLAPAEAAAAKVGVADVSAELLPEDKVTAVLARRPKATGWPFAARRAVAMVGDGVNDAAALAAADVGIAMGAAGTQVAMENAHVVLMDSDLRKLTTAVKLGRTAMRKVKQNVFFALFSKLVMVVLAVVGYASLWSAIVVDLGSMLIVTINASLVLSQRKAKGDAHGPGPSHEGEVAKSRWALPKFGGGHGPGHGGHGHGHDHSCCRPPAAASASAAADGLGDPRGHVEGHAGHGDSHGGGHDSCHGGHSHGGKACGGHGDSHGGGHHSFHGGHSHGGKACGGHGDSHGGGYDSCHGGHSHGGKGGGGHDNRHGGDHACGHGSHNGDSVHGHKACGCH